MKTNKIKLLIKIFFYIFLIGCSSSTKTSFGLLKKSVKKANTNNITQNHSQTSTKKSQTGTIASETPFQETTAITKDINKMFNPDQKDSNDNVSTLPDQPIYAQGWIKYLHYDDAGKFKPKRFWKNTLFEQEQRINEDNSNPSSDEVKKNLLFL